MSPPSVYEEKEDGAVEHLEDGHHELDFDEDNGKALRPKTIMALIALTLTFGSQLGVGSNMTPSILSEIAAEFDATSVQGWISSGWLMSTCVAFVISGRLSDIFGRGAIITFSNVLAMGGFAMCAWAPTFPVLIGGIVLLGAAGGLAQTATAAACEIVPNKYRPLAIAFLEMGIAPTGYLAGSTFSHMIIAHTTYKWVFRLGLILCGVGLVLCLLFYRPPAPLPEDGKTRAQQFASLDFIGMALFSGGLSVFLMGVIWAGGTYPGNNIHVYLPIVIGLVTLLLFCAWEWRMGDDGLVPPHLFKGKTRSFTLPIVCHFVAGTVFFSMIALWPIQSALWYTDSLVGVGLLGLPAGCAVFAGGCLIGPFIPKLGPTNRQMLFWMTVMVTAVACMAALTSHTKVGAIACQVIANLPFHIIVNLSFLSVQFSQHGKDIGIATGLSGASRSLGGTVAVSIYLTIFGARVPTKVPAGIAAAVADDGLSSETVASLIGLLMDSNTTAAAALPGMTTTILASAVEGMNQGYAQCFKAVYLATLGFGIPGIIAAYFVEDVSEHFTDHVRMDLNRSRPQAIDDTKV